jgi:hypothetical protein
MRNLILANMIWNTLFVAMAISEVLGVTSVHEALPWYLKWIWITLLAGGNLVIHLMQLRLEARRRAS